MREGHRTRSLTEVNPVRIAEEEQVLLGLGKELARLHTARGILLAAEQIDDPVEALREAIVRTCQLQQADRGILQTMLSSADALRDLAEEHLLPISNRIVARAKAAGRVRPDFEATDLPMIFMLSGALNQETRPELWCRYVNALLDGFMVHDRDRVGAIVGAPTEAEIERITTGDG